MSFLIALALIELLICLSQVFRGCARLFAAFLVGIGCSEIVFGVGPRIYRWRISIAGCVLVVCAFPIGVCAIYDERFDDLDRPTSAFLVMAGILGDLVLVAVSLVVFYLFEVQIPYPAMIGFWMSVYFAWVTIIDLVKTSIVCANR